MKRTMMLFLIAALLLCGCGMIPPTDSLDISAPETTDPSSAATVPTTTGPLLAKDYLGEYYKDFEHLNIANYEILIPENDVLIFTGQEFLEEVFVEGDVYITYNADVSLHNVYVRGNVYVHGILRSSGLCWYPVFTYTTNTNTGRVLCSAYDGLHGQFIPASGSKCQRYYISCDALDYAFEKWGKFGPEVQSQELLVSKKPVEPRVAQYCDALGNYSDVYIFTGEGLVTNETIPGDVYITSDAVIEFEDVKVRGDIYCYGQLKFSNHESSTGDMLLENNKAYTIYAYQFNKSCDSFDGTHGLIVGGPIKCKDIVISDVALDYAFETFGKQ